MGLSLLISQGNSGHRTAEHSKERLPKWSVRAISFKIEWTNFEVWNHLHEVCWKKHIFQMKEREFFIYLMLFVIEY